MSKSRTAAIAAAPVVRHGRLPLVSPISTGGIELNGELLRRARRGAQQINRGDYYTFNSIEDEVRFIFGKRT